MMAKRDYDEWADCLMKLQAITSPAEVQGMLCGRLSGGQRLEQEAWLQAAVEFMDLVEPDLAQALDPESRGALLSLYEENLDGLNDPAQSLHLLLPPDELGLVQRIDALAGWCEGFLHGLGASGLQGGSQLSPEVAEALRDIAHIAQAKPDDDDTDENEIYYTELVEYVRVAVLTLFLEFNASPPAAPIH